MSNRRDPKSGNPLADLISGLVVFLVALPLCLGVAVASRPTGGDDPASALFVPAFAGLLAGIVGGILVGLISGSHTSVSGPAAGLTAVVAAQITATGSFQAFLLAVCLAGVLQIGLGVLRAGNLAGFFPSSVIKGLLAAIGVILILKQFPHLFGRDTDPEGDLSFFQKDSENTFSELLHSFDQISEPGAAVVGVLSLLLLFGWDRVKALKTSLIPAPLVVVVVGVGLAELLRALGAGWEITGSSPDKPTSHLVEVPVAADVTQFLGFLTHPDFGQWANSKVWIAAVTIAVVASLETLLNLEAVDRLDPRQRVSPPNRELVAQGAGNLLSGLIGGLPVTSVIVRSSVNINSGARTKLSAVWHGVLLLGCVALVPGLLNRIPLACLAAILMHTGFKLASPKLVKQMWRGGRQQFLPFVVTVLAIVFTDLLIGVLIGLGVALLFILRSNLRRPMHKIVEKHLGGEVVRIELANQVSFLNRAALDAALNEVPAGGHVLLDASATDYIDPDILNLIREFHDTTAPARGVQVSLRGFQDKYHLHDETRFVDYSTRELQEAVTPRQVLQILKDGNERFRTGQRLSRDLGRQVNATAAGQHPLAVLLTCIDSRSPAELIFDLGVGDIFVARMAGNVASRKILGSMEYATAVAGAKLVLVLGHTRCGAVTAACSKPGPHVPPPEDEPGKDHIEHILASIRQSIDPHTAHEFPQLSPDRQRQVADDVSRRNVVRMVDLILEESAPIAELARTGRVLVVGALYDVASGGIEFLTERGAEPPPVPAPPADGVLAAR